ncbi:MAG: hypothetical protein KatS3mg049_2989 [Caldilinea sp.]|nr:MAG: hypothetical protein KatS3mg049_2989 [Caldilinea sp.]
MKSSMMDIPVSMDIPEGTLRQVEWGGMTVELGAFRQTVDATPLFKGLPDDRCQCPHWGYVLKGRLRYQYADHEEIYSAGEVYYVPPGHTPILEAGAEYIEFSPTDKLMQTMQVVERNMQAMEQK